MPVKPMIIAGALGLVAALVGAPSAQAVDTDATFAITSTGSLTISAPASTVDLGSVAEGNLSFAPTLGDVTVTDTRSLLVSDWTATATGTHFDLQGAGADPTGDTDHRVANTAILYTATPAYDSGTGVLTPPSGTLAVGATVIQAGTGDNQVTWDPTLTFTLSATQQNGTYAGTITHSVL